MLNRDRITLNPLEESTLNMPVEICGDRYGHGVFIQPGGAQWGPPAAETPQLAQSVDTEGALAIATTIGLRQSPVLKIQVIEPNDPADTNWMLNPQVVGTTNYAQVGATGRMNQQMIRDLVGYDYAIFQSCPGLNPSEGVKSNAGVIPGLALGQQVTFGVWAKGTIGGESVTISASGVSKTVALTTSWQFYTVTNTSVATLTTNIAYIISTTQSLLSFYTTGFTYIVNSGLTEPFDGTYPGCNWSGIPHASPSARPSAGGPRRDAIMSDVEDAVTLVSRTRVGTIRRILPNGKRVTFDVLGVTLQWDDLSQSAVGVAKGTISFTCQPYGRGPEIATISDSFNPFVSPTYILDAGTASNLVNTGSGLSVGAAGLGTEIRLLNNSAPWPLYQGEVSAAFAQTSSGTVAGYKAGVILNRQNSANYIEAYVTYTGSVYALNLDKVVAGVRTNLVTTVPPAIPTSFVIRARSQMVSNTLQLYVELFNGVAAVSNTATPTYASAAFTMSDATFGPLRSCLGGIVWTPKQVTTDTATALNIYPYLARERTLPVLQWGLAGVPGTAPALGRMVITDNSGNDQYFCRWGQTQDRTSNLTSLTGYFYEAESLTALNGSSVVNIGGNSGGQSIQSTGLSNTMAGVMSTQTFGGGAQLAHLGDYEIWARVLTWASGTISFALQWSVGDSISFTINPTVSTTCPTLQWQLVSLGQIHVPTATIGNQQWQGTILASSTVVGDLLAIDYLVLVPVGAGAATIKGGSQTFPISPAIFTARDEFNQAAGALNGVALPVGGTWQTAGAGTDYQTVPAYHEIQRTYTDAGTAISGAGANPVLPGNYINGKIAKASTPSISGVAVGANVVNVQGNGAIGTTQGYFGLLAHYTSATNWVGMLYGYKNTDFNYYYPYMSVVKMSSIAAPSGLAVAAVAGGGTFAANTYFWKITGVNSNGESIGSNEATVAVALNGHANLSWSNMPGAATYNIYRSTTTGVYTPTALLASGVVATSYTDTGAALNAGAIPTVYGTSAGNATFANTLWSGNPIASFNGVWMTMQLQIGASGKWYAFAGLGPYSASFSGSLYPKPPMALVGSGSDPDLANGGQVGTGSVGIYDWNTDNTVQRAFGQFWAAPFTTDAAFYSGQSLEVRSDRANRQDAGATLWTPPTSYVGDYMRVTNPQTYDGIQRLVVKSSRNDPASSNDPVVNDAIQAQVNITPRYSSIPSL